MNYALAPQIWPSFLTVLLMLTLSVYSGRRRSVPGALPFMIACLFAVAHAAGSVMEFAATDITSKIFWFKVQGVWNIPIITAITCFLLEYAWPGRWLTRRNLAILSILCLLGLGLILTNDLHHLLWRNFTLQGSVKVQFGPVGWLLVVYVFGVLGGLNLVICGWLFLHSLQQRWPVAIMIMGQFGGRLLFLAVRTNLLRSVLPLDLFGMAFEFLMYAIALFGFQILDPIPLARRMAIEQLHAGVLVLNPSGNVVSLNPTAQAILGMPEKHLLKRPIQEFLPIGVKMPVPGRTEIRHGIGEATRHYQLEASTLNDWRGLEVGRLLLLHDVTEQKRAQAQEMERLWAHATLQEREQLAGELHDGLSQSLGFLNLQAQTAQVYLQAGQNEAARDSLARLTEAAGQIQEDTRELIGNLLVVIRPAENFCATLRHVLAAFEQQTSLAVHLDIDTGAPPVPAGGGGGEDCFDPSRLPPLVAVQLVRITQEALANMRRHARGASQAHVELKARDGQVFLTIADDGAGFDPDAPRTEGKHFGLQVIRQRAARVGGQVEVWSAPGKGTRITVCVPMAPLAAGD